MEELAPEAEQIVAGHAMQLLTRELARELAENAIQPARVSRPCASSESACQDENA